MESFQAVEEVGSDKEVTVSDVLLPASSLQFAVLLGVILTAGFPEGDCLDLFLMLAVKFRYILFVFVFFVRRRVRQQNAPHKAYANNCTET